MEVGLGPIGVEVALGMFGKGGDYWGLPQTWQLHSQLCKGAQMEFLVREVSGVHGFVGSQNSTEKNPPDTAASWGCKQARLSQAAGG